MIMNLRQRKMKNIESKIKATVYSPLFKLPVYPSTKLGLNDFPQIFYYQLAVKICSLYLTYLRVPFSSQQKQSFWDF